MIRHTVLPDRYLIVRCGRVVRLREGAWRSTSIRTGIEGWGKGAQVTYPSLVREDKFRDVLEVVKVEDGVDGRPRVHERESALLFGRDLLDDLLDGAGIDGAEAE